MPPKRDKRKAGAASSNGTGSGSTVASRRTTRHNNASGAATNGGASTPSKRQATPKPEQTSGRNTNNSRGKRSLRRLAANRTPTPTVKRAAGKRVGTRGKKEKELTSFKDDNGVVYNAGGKTQTQESVCAMCVCV